MNISFYKLAMPVLSLVLLAMTGCHSDDNDSSSDGTSSSSVNLEFQTCWNADLTSENAQCGFYSAHKDINDPQSEERKVGFVVLPALGDNTSSLPLIYFIGGPGVSNTFGYSAFRAGGANEQMRKQPLILVDYRSVGMSEPYVNDLGCNLFPDFEDEDSVMAYNNCASQLSSIGFDFSDIRSAVFIDDTSVILTGLGYEKAVVYGASYGTRLALTMLRDHPEQVSHMILDGSFPPEVNGSSQLAEILLAALDVGVKKCSNNQSCDSRFGDLSAKLESIVSKYTTAFGATKAVDLISRVASVAHHPAFPLLVEHLDGLGAEEGKTALTETIEFGEYGDAGETSGGCTPTSSLLCQRSLSMALTMGILCSEEAAFVAEQPLNNHYGFSESLANSFSSQFKAGFPFSPGQLKDDCANRFTVASADRIEIEPVVNSDVPVLLLSGGRDLQTSPVWADLAASKLAKSQHLLFPLLDHGVYSDSLCAQKLVTAFTADANAPLDTSCVPADLAPLTSTDDITQAFTTAATQQYYQ